MSLALYVLDVPEFQPVVRAAEAAGLTTQHVGDYVELRTHEPEAVLRRDGAVIRAAVWHAALTGGLDGRIVSFTSDTLHLAKETG
ncbi:hypothetical protein AB0I84_18930 [Streptomyces spectabilis]|uniref:Uncharacterized protein n=1 Tax=Streptomyces spectabilis TaxID=68270 RepID=A0A5P2XL92_STRST|nr:hypothetical protein [Streptomyces spectabilis]MBB5105258.1 hypothetical protein [Streptomyces spectabilis]MCI3906452.1 hypothetical protein [Streptomyces spectabilis]QEV63296.1 hypothetical protein CP982_35145 [Streptomyces spectabilis]GGV51557.1 hypothetical protein GCM10010245_81250 [Streptomyces spectabilis]